ncbi:GlcNAc-transferase family protein [Filimonas effusa]|uniref:N-acetylglucosaminyltransferase n=1 Tax=Filimonas effusa TaxID=2508721 RepID=A0A4Q1D9F1_9BACT|nr:GlcNAc-transferase family protein [Filimonas effusa]RXK85850.1 N-acetylglucosaminyltransferase [Filimonas effusa]
MLIFVQIAAYRDPQLLPTINSMLQNARTPEQLRICICRQYHPDDKFDNVDIFRKDNRFTIIDVFYADSKGVCWARNLIQQHYNGEDLTLQIDSHMRFAKDWDHKLTLMLASLQSTGIRKPLLTGYPPAFEPDIPFSTETPVAPSYMQIEGFTSAGIPTFIAKRLTDWQHLSAPIPARFYSAGFCFTVGIFCTEVPHDPDIYYIGEEISIAVRAYTHGYDLFHPHQTVIWHQYERKGVNNHWDDHTLWRLKDQSSFEVVRNLLTGKYGKEYQYGPGTERSLAEYERYVEVDFQKQLLHLNTATGAPLKPRYARCNI